MKKVSVILATLGLLTLGAGAANATSTLPPCPTEDSDNCVWNAQEQGNGQGRSFTVIEGVVTYWDAPIDAVADLPSDPGTPEGEAIDGPTVYPLTDAAGWTAETCAAAGMEWADTFCFTPIHYDDPGAESYPAPAVEAELPPADPVPDTTAPVTAAVPETTAPVSVPIETAERVAAGEELAYTGAAENALTAGIAASVLSAGAALIYLSRRKPAVTKI